MVSTNILRFNGNPQDNRQAIAQLQEALEERCPERILAIQHDVRGGLARIALSFAPTSDAAQEKHYQVGEVSIPVGQNITIQEILTQLDVDGALEDLGLREQA